MHDWRQTLISQNLSIFDAVRIIDKGALQIALVVDKNNKLLGVVTDGDIRRALLHRIDFSSPVSEVMNKQPKVVFLDASDSEIHELMHVHGLRHVPVVNDQGELVDLKLIDCFHSDKKYDNCVILMAGGLGQRLGELTNDRPKPMLNIGGKPLLEIIIENFIAAGFYKFYLSLNYKGHVIEDYFEDGAKWGGNIQYLKETKKLGTAGCLSLIPEKLNKPFIVMNGDLLTKINFKQMLNYHQMHKAQATMGVREYDQKVPYGVIDLNGHEIVSMTEKPIYRFFVNAGIYIFNPEIQNLVTESAYCDMTHLFERIIENKYKSVSFPIREYWLDIGRDHDFHRANDEYMDHF